MLIPLKLKQIFSPLVKLFIAKKIFSAPSNNNIPANAIYDISVKDIDGNLENLSKYKGYKLLIVNVASECGYTPQYTQLQELYKTHQPKLMILGFPSNDFGRQEPGSNEQIKIFCSEQYNVTFPLFLKSSVKGEHRNPLYQWLSDKNLNGWCNEQPSWNFCKYLVDENGRLLNYFSQLVGPFDKEILKNL